MLSCGTCRRRWPLHSFRTHAPPVGKSNRRWGWSAKERSHYVKWPRAGVVIGPKGRAAWTVKDAQYFNLAQRRERVLVVADFGNGADPAAVLFEPEGVRRHSPPSREAGQGVAATTSTSVERSSVGFAPVAGTLTSAMGRRCGTPNEDNPPDYLVHVPEIARCVATREGQSQDFESTTMLAVSVVSTIAAPLIAKDGRGVHSDMSNFVAVSVTGPISHALKAEGADASEDGTGRGTPIICVHGTQDPLTSRHVSFPLGRNTGQENVVAYAVALRGREGGGSAELGGDTAFTLRASGGGDKPHVLTSAVRRLTPRECERLQGFQFRVDPEYPGAWRDQSGRWWSPDYTAIPWRGKPASECPDGPRYKTLGNSWAVPKFRWLGARIARLMPR